MRSVFVAIALLLLGAPLGAAAEDFETVTSVTTYSTHNGVHKDARPAFVLDAVAAASYRPDPLTTRIHDEIQRAASMNRKAGEAAIKYVSEIKAENWYKGFKSAGAVAVVIAFGPEAAVYYAFSAGVGGAFEPLGKVIDHGIAVGDVKPGTAEFERLVSARLAVIGRDGKVQFAGYQAMASNRSGLGDALHYTMRGISSPKSRWHLFSYLFGEIVSFYSGKLGEALGGNPIQQEGLGVIFGTAAEEKMVALTAPQSGGGKYITMTVPDGRGGYRSTTIPSVNLSPSISAAPMPDLDARLIRPGEVLPFAVAQAASTLRVESAPRAQPLIIMQPSRSVIIVAPRALDPPRPDLTAALPSEQSAPQVDYAPAPAPAQPSRSVPLPSRVELTGGFGGFSIKP